MEPSNLAFSPECLVSNGRQALLGGIKLGGSALEYQRQQEEERYESKRAESYWNYPFFRHCWNEGLKLPTRNNCSECSE